MTRTDPAPLPWVFMGSDAIAQPALEALAERSDARLAGVFTQPDRPVGRGQRVEPNAIKAFAAARGVPVRQPDRIGPEDLDWLRRTVADGLILVFAYGHLLKPELLAIPVRGVWNLHTSPLPALRGASPIQTAVAEGWRETAVTLMRIHPRLDAGPVVGSEAVPIAPGDTAVEVEARLARAVVPLLERWWPALREGTAREQPQEEAEATYCRRLTKEDAAIDFDQPAGRVAARINGLQPWPGAETAGPGGPIKVGLAAAEAEGTAVPGCPGTVLEPDETAVRVAARTGVVRLLRLQRPGGRMLPAADFRRGHPLPPGTLLASRPGAPLVSRQPFKR